SEQGEVVGVRQAEIQHDDAERAAGVRCFLNRGSTGSGFDDGVAAIAQGFSDRPPDQRFIVDHENAGLRFIGFSDTRLATHGYFEQRKVDTGTGSVSGWGIAAVCARSCCESVGTFWGRGRKSPTSPADFSTAAAKFPSTSSSPNRHPS